MSDVFRKVNRLAKWRTVFAGWQLGSRTKADPEAQAVRDQIERALIMRAELSALSQVLIAKGIITAEELTAALGNEADLLSKQLEQKFPGFQARDDGMLMTAKAAETTKGWRP